MRFLKIIGKSFIDFFRDEGLMLAGSMSYFTMMALIPFCLFMLTLLGYLLGQYPEFYRFFSGKLAGLFPAVTEDVTREILKLISNKGLGKVSLFLYGFLSYQVFASFEHSLNVIFKVTKKRNIVASVLLSLAMVTLLLGLIMASFAAASAVPLINVAKPYLPAVKIGKMTGFILRFVLPFVLMLFAATVLYKMLPKARVKFPDAFKGAFFTTLFLEVAKYVFTLYVVKVMHLGKIYGSLSAFIVFLLWMFYSSSIFLIGAEIVHNLGRPRKH